MYKMNGDEEKRGFRSPSILYVYIEVNNGK